MSIFENIVQEEWYVESTEDIGCVFIEFGLSGADLKSVSDDKYTIETTFNSNIKEGAIFKLPYEPYPRKIISIISESLAEGKMVFKINKKLTKYYTNDYLSIRSIRNEDGIFDTNEYESFSDRTVNEIVMGENLSLYKCSEFADNLTNIYLYKDDISSTIKGVYDNSSNDLTNVDKIFTYNKSNAKVGDEVNFIQDIKTEIIKGDFGGSEFNSTNGIETNIFKIIINGTSLESSDYTRDVDKITITNSSKLNDFNYMTIISYPNRVDPNTPTTLYYKGYIMETGFLYDWYRDNIPKIKLIDSASTTMSLDYNSFKGEHNRKNTNTLTGKQSSRLSFTAKLSSELVEGEVRTHLRNYISNPDNFRIFKVVEEGYVGVYSGCSLDDGIGKTDQKSPTNEITYSISFLDYELWRYVGTDVDGNANGYIKELVE